MIHSKDLMTILTDLLNEASESIEKSTETIKKKTDALKESAELPSIVQEQLEMLRMADLKTIIRAHMPKNANAVAAYFTKTDNANRIILTYLNNNEIIPAENNKMINVNSEFISREVESLFNDNSVIILN